MPEQFSDELKKKIPNKCLLNSAMNFLAHMYTWQCVWSSWQFSDELSCPRVYIHTHGKFSNKLSCPHIKQLSQLQKTMRWTFCPSEVTIRESTVQRWMFCSSEFYYIIILLIYLHDIPLWNFNIGAHWLTFLLIYLSNWAEMRFNKILSVPNFHLNAHILCERVPQLGVKLQLQ